MSKSKIRIELGLGGIVLIIIIVYMLLGGTL